MKKPSENPHLQTLLEKKGLEIFKGQSAALNIESNTNITVGDLLPTGVVVGFHFDETNHEAPLTALVYDESKDADDNALTTIRCSF